MSLNQIGFAMLKKLFISILLLLFIPAIVFASRGINVIPIKDKTGNQVGLYKESHALIIGVSDYTAGWPDLPGVKKDVRLVRAALEKAGFNVVVSQDPDRVGMIAAFDNFINKYGNNPDTRLLFYFAGHGHTLKLAYGGDMGYIIPTNAPNPNKDKNGFLAKALDMKTIEVYAEKIQAKHAMFLFDSCFSGSIFALSRAIPENISAKTSKPVRQFITAGAANETVPDESIFRHQFVEALNGEGDTDKDGYVTGIELGEFLNKNVVNYSRGSQHPQYGKIRNPYLDKGDFVFPLKTARLTDAPASPKETSPTPPAKKETALERILREAEEKKQKAAQIKRNRKAHNQEIESLYAKLQDVDKMEESALSSEAKVEAWSEFIRKYGGNNPRQEDARKNLEFWQKMARLPIEERGKKKASKGMMHIPGGDFLAGAAPSSGYAVCQKIYNNSCKQSWYSDEGPEHRVLIDDFFMDQYEVTQADFERVMGKHSSKFKGANRPVENVTWHQAKAYCEKLGKRLPTEAEWEKAARGRTTTKYYWGNEYDGAYAWGHKNSSKETHPVGQKKPNKFGLYDMAGNVSEWTADWYDENYYQQVSRNNPKGPSSGSQKVLRGGSWGHDLRYMRSADRDKNDPSKLNIFLGFRCAFGIPSTRKTHTAPPTKPKPTLEPKVDLFADEYN
jgi:formylglycine-generating enzyme required for sulfatase activity